MIDKGFNRGLVQSFDTRNRRTKGAFYGIRKMFWDYLNKLGVPFYDTCCVEANGSSDDLTILPVRFNSTSGATEAYSGTWVPVSAQPTMPQDDIAAGTGGPIPVDNYLTTINTDAGGDDFTIGDGLAVGQLKKILLVVDGGGDAVVTPDSFTGGTTITFNTAGDYVLMAWSGAYWAVIENSGASIA